MKTQSKPRKSVVKNVKVVKACPASCDPVQILQQLVSGADLELVKSLIGASVNEAANAKKQEAAERQRRRDELLQLDQNYADDMKKLQSERAKAVAAGKDWSREFEENKNRLEALRAELSQAEKDTEEIRQLMTMMRDKTAEYDARIKELEAKRVAVYKEWNEGGYAAAAVKRRDELLRLDKDYENELKDLNGWRLKEVDALKELTRRVEDYDEAIKFARTAITSYDEAIRDLEAKRAAVQRELREGGYDIA